MSGDADGVRRAVEALEGIPHAADRAREAGRLLAQWPDLHRQVREIRQQAVIVMRDQGMTFAEIGEALDITRERAWQIHKGQTSGRVSGDTSAADT